MKPRSACDLQSTLHPCWLDVMAACSLRSPDDMFLADHATDTMRLHPYLIKHNCILIIRHGPLTYLRLPLHSDLTFSDVVRQLHGTVQILLHHAAQLFDVLQGPGAADSTSHKGTSQLGAQQHRSTCCPRSNFKVCIMYV